MSETINIKRKPYRNQGPSTHNSYNHQTPTLQTSMQVKRKSNNNTRHHTKPDGNHTEIKESQTNTAQISNENHTDIKRKPNRNQRQSNDYHIAILEHHTKINEHQTNVTHAY